MPSPLAREDREAILGLLEARYGSHLTAERMSLDGRVEPGFVELRFCLDRLDETFRYAIEIRVSTVENAISDAVARDTAVDFLGFCLDEYFKAERDLYLPLDFQPYPFGEHTVHARGDVTNPYLDRLADEILESGKVRGPHEP